MFIKETLCCVTLVRPLAQQPALGGLDVVVVAVAAVVEVELQPGHLAVLPQRARVVLGVVDGGPLHVRRHARDLHPGPELGPRPEGGLHRSAALFT